MSLIEHFISHSRKGRFFCACGKSGTFSKVKKHIEETAAR